MFSKRFKIITFVLFLCLIIYFIFSYFGFWIFTPLFNQFDLTIISVIGNSILVGIVTYFSTKTVSLYLSKKEYERNNTINISVIEKDISIINYKQFIEIMENSNSRFMISNDNMKVLHMVYELYRFLIDSYNFDNLDKYANLILNLPFNYYGEERDIRFTKENFKHFIDSLSKVKKPKIFESFSLASLVLSDDDFENLVSLKKIIGNIKHYEVVNLNNSMGYELNIKVGNKNNIITCLPNSKIDIYVYYDTNKSLSFRPIKINFNGTKEEIELVKYKYDSNDKTLRETTGSSFDYDKFHEYIIMYNKKLEKLINDLENDI